MSVALTRSLSGVLDRQRLVFGLAILGKSLLFGVIAGMATFVYVAHPWAQSWVSQWWMVVVMAFAGSANVWYVDELRPAILTSILSVGIAFAVHVAAWTAPVFVTDYQLIARRVLVLSYMGQGVTSAILVLPIAYFGGFFLALLWFSTIGY